MFIPKLQLQSEAWLEDDKARCEHGSGYKRRGCRECRRDALKMAYREAIADLVNNLSVDLKKH